VVLIRADDRGATEKVAQEFKSLGAKGIFELPTALKLYAANSPSSP
jgi:hypothetical protein